jgi:hypothetical protein
MLSQITYHHVISVEIAKTDNFPADGKTEQFYATRIIIMDDAGNKQEICLIHDLPLITNFKRLRKMS